MFDTYPTYPPFRTLRLSSPAQRGEDVYALQIALTECGFPCGVADGIFGAQTQGAVKAAQTKLGLEADGLAGGLTQRGLALMIAEAVAEVTHVPFRAFKGQLELESGYRLGIVSPIRADGTYDAGVAQRNTKYTPPEIAFDPQTSIDALGANTRKHYDLFAGVKTDVRRWGLAQGAWNAPAFACYLAREEGATKVTTAMILKPSASSRETFEAYIRSASAYLPT